MIPLSKSSASIDCFSSSSRNVDNESKLSIRNVNEIKKEDKEYKALEEKNRILSEHNEALNSSNEALLIQNTIQKERNYILNRFLVSALTEPSPNKVSGVGPFSNRELTILVEKYRDLSNELLEDNITLKLKIETKEKKILELEEKAKK